MLTLSLFASPVIQAEESKALDPLLIPWPSCGIGSDTGQACKQEVIDTKKESKTVVEEITQEDLDKFSDSENRVAE